MSSRQKLYFGLAISAGVAASVALYLYLRHRRKLKLSQASVFGRIQSTEDQQYSDITVPPEDGDESIEFVRFRSDDATYEVEVPGGCSALTTEQAIMMTRFLDSKINDTECLHRILTNIANSATIAESQVNLTNAGCVDHLRNLLMNTNNETTICKTLLALNNLALNDYTITYFSGIASIVMNLYRTTRTGSTVRPYCLNLLINMSVFEYLHDEYLKDLDEFDEFVKLTLKNNGESLSMAKVLVNLSANRANLEKLLQLTGIELKTIVVFCESMKKKVSVDESTQCEDILLRYITFYCNLAESVVSELQNNMPDKLQLTNASLYQLNSVYHELFNHDKQMLNKAILRPQYSSNTVNQQIKRLLQAMDAIRHILFETSVLLVNDEFNDDDNVTTTADFSTPKKPSETAGHFVANENVMESSFDDLAKEVNEQFEDDSTILPDASVTSDVSLTSFCSARSTYDNNTYASPENSMSN